MNKPCPESNAEVTEHITQYLARRGWKVRRFDAGMLTKFRFKRPGASVASGWGVNSQKLFLDAVNLALDADKPRI